MPEAYHPGVFEIEHIIPKKHGGRSSLGNLAYSCLRCSRCKGTNLAGLDRTLSPTKPVILFHPRRHKWDWHFRWDGPVLIGRTSIGRVTVDVLNMNDSDRVELRAILIEEGVFP